VSANMVGAASLALAPAQSARCLGRREKGVRFLLGAALRWGANGTFRGHLAQHGERFIGGIPVGSLERMLPGRG